MFRIFFIIFYYFNKKFCNFIFNYNVNIYKQLSNILKNFIATKIAHFDLSVHYMINSGEYEIFLARAFLYTRIA